MISGVFYDKHRIRLHFWGDIDFHLCIPLNRDPQCIKTKERNISRAVKCEKGLIVHITYYYYIA